MEEVVVLQVQSSQLVQTLQLHGVDGAHLVVAEQDGLQGWEVIQDTGEHLKPAAGERRDSQEQGTQKKRAFMGAPSSFKWLLVLTSQENCVKFSPALFIIVLAK